MKEFYLFEHLDYSPGRDCGKCPHRHNSLLMSNNITPNVLERFEVRHSWCNMSQKYPTLDVARQAIRVFCDYGYIFKKKYKSLKMAEYLTLSIRYPARWEDDRFYINGKLYAEIIKLF